MKGLLRPLAISIWLIFLMACKESTDTQAEASSERPNIILLVGDDQGYPYFGFMGADYVYTPNMDSLAQSGVLFTDGYVPQNHCRPSLQTLMTGTLPIAYGLRRDSIMQAEMQQEAYLQLPEEKQKTWRRDFDFHAMKYFETLPRMLNREGYATFQGGKWWEYNYQNGGFSTGMTTGWKEEDLGQNDWFHQFMGGDGTNLARVTMEPVYDFIEQAADKPFFIWYAPELPHYPFDAPDKYYNLYRDKDMTESAKRYYANCSWFDDGVGELKRFLTEKGEFDNTLFIYVNDNGWEQNPNQEFRHDSLRWHNGGDKGKLSIYDQSFRTPIIFSWPGHIEAGKRYGMLMHSADIPATILDYLQLDIPTDFFGRSYRKAIEGSSFEARTEIVGKVNVIRAEEDMMGKQIEGYWLRNTDWFFKWNLTEGTIGLFDMGKDPTNEVDVSAEHPDLVAAYKAKIEAWKRSYSSNI